MGQSCGLWKRVWKTPASAGPCQTIEELKANLIDIYQDISSGLVPDATPFEIEEVAV
ncbi:MAG: hypothetical protein ABR534_15750 [Desulfotignum sp.]